jgi:hypothetical protein
MMRAKISTERRAQARVHAERRIGEAVLEARQVRRVDPGGIGEGSSREGGVLMHPSHVFAEDPVETINDASGLGECPGRCHQHH